MTEEQVKKIKQIKMDVCHTFGSEAGARTLKWLRETCFKYDTTYEEEDKLMNINEGRRQVLLSLENMMELDIEELVKKQEGE